MSVYTVHEPPLGGGDGSPQPERFKFVPDGFSVWAFLLAPLWMLWHRMWLVFVVYLVVSGGLEALVKALGASNFAATLVGLLISLLVGLEASTLRRFTLSRCGWKTVGVVSGEDLEGAERRFFAAWLRDSPIAQGTPAAVVAQTPALSARMPQPPGVIGLFPEPGGSR